MFIREGGLMFRTFAQFLFKMTFSRGAGGVQNAFGNSRGVGGFIFLLKNGNSGEVGGLTEIPSVVGVWIFSGTTYYSGVPLTLSLPEVIPM